MSSSLRTAARLPVLLAMTLLLLPVQIALVVLRLDQGRRLPRLYHRLCVRLFGFDVRIVGTVSAARPTLYVSNHISYVDITVLGSILDAGFIAKAEIAGWPIFGLLAKLQGSVFVDRRGRKAAAQRDEIGRRLAAGDSLVLFPEGTSSDGRTVLPFKTALFAVAHADTGDRPLAVQPVSICYTRLNGLPLGRALRPYIGWYGGMTLLPHLLTLLGLRRVTVEVRFHPVLIGAAGLSRKELAEACRRVIVAGLDAARHGESDVAAAADPPAASGAAANS